MGIMPYHLEKGAFMIAMEDWFNEGLNTAPAALNERRNTTAVARRLQAYNGMTEMLHQLSAKQNAPTIVDVLHDLFNAAKLSTVPNVDWAFRLGLYFMGLTKTGGTWTHQSEPAVAGKPTGQTGALTNYFGNVERILGETLVRAIEVSLGLKATMLDGSHRPTAATTDDVKWVWPLDCTLACESPWFEGWVLWSQVGHAPGAGGGPPPGQVTLVFHTPGHGGKVRAEPALPGPGGGPSPDGYADDCGTGHPFIDVCQRANPANPRPRGMWLVTHSKHVTIARRSTAASGAGQWSPPPIGFTYPADYDRVVTV